MRQPFALFKLRLTPRLWVQDWGIGFARDLAVPNAPPLTPYVFRKGNLWQPTPTRWVLPTDAAIPDAPPLTQYTFRPGGFWQTSKIWIQPPPRDLAVPDAPPLVPYTFRLGGFWKPQLPLIFADYPPPPPPPPPPPVMQYHFRPGGFYQPSKIWTDVSAIAAPIIVIQPFAPLPPPAGGGSWESPAQRKRRKHREKLMENISELETLMVYAMARGDRKKVMALAAAINEIREELDIFNNARAFRKGKLKSTIR